MVLVSPELATGLRKKDARIFKGFNSVLYSFRARH